MRRSIRQRGLPARLQNCELFKDSEMNDDGDFVHFALTAEYKPIKMDEVLSDPKWIYAIKGDLELIEFFKSRKGLLMYQRRYTIEILKKSEIEHCNVVITQINQGCSCRRMRMSKTLIQLNI